MTIIHAPGLSAETVHGKLGKRSRIYTSGPYAIEATTLRDRGGLPVLLLVDTQRNVLIASGGSGRRSETALINLCSVLDVARVQGRVELRKELEAAK